MCKPITVAQITWSALRIMNYTNEVVKISRIYSSLPLSMVRLQEGTNRHSEGNLKDAIMLNSFNRIYIKSIKIWLVFYRGKDINIVSISPVYKAIGSDSIIYRKVKYPIFTVLKTSLYTFSQIVSRTSIFHFLENFPCVAYFLKNMIHP